MRVCFVTSSQDTTEVMNVIGLDACTDINDIQLSDLTLINLVEYCYG